MAGARLARGSGQEVAVTYSAGAHGAEPPKHGPCDPLAPGWRSGEDRRNTHSLVLRLQGSGASSQRPTLTPQFKFNTPVIPLHGTDLVRALTRLHSSTLISLSENVTSYLPKRGLDGRMNGDIRYLDPNPSFPRCVLTKNWMTKHLVLMRGLSKQRVGEGARGVGKASQVRASGQGVNQRVHWAC